MDIIVKGNRLYLGDKNFPCAIGRSGISTHKKEGDGTTPAGKFPLREVFYRSDRMEKPKCNLPIRATKPDWAWCEDANDSKYNQLIIVPNAENHPEKLWREDNLYNLIVVIGYNDSPVIKEAGSAIFMHLARENYAPTAGCVALALADLLFVVSQISTDTNLLINAE